MTPLANPVFAVIPVPPMTMPPILAVSDLIRDLSIGMRADTSEAGSGNASGRHIRSSEGHSSECRCHNQALLH
jgi:hypothetical protein